MIWRAGIGRSVRRIEDEPLLRGEGRFAADIDLPRQLHMRVVRSEVACGLLRAVRTEAALASPGVAAVWTAADVADIEPIDFRLRQPGFEQMVPYRQPVLAHRRVRYVGEPVAAVFADDPYRAEDAADEVEVEIDPLDPVLDPTTAPGDFGDGLDTEAMVFTEQVGDADAALAAAHRVIELELSVGRHSGIPLECRGALARLHPDTGVLEVLGAAKVPFHNRDELARMTGLPPSRVVLRESHVGGGFGIRGELYPEDVLTALAAVRLRRPVKWIEDRREHMVAANHSRDQHHRVRAAVAPDGVIAGLDVAFVADQGAYVRTHGATVPTLTAALLPGPYRIPNYRVAGRVRLTNKTPAGTYRSPGRYEGTFVRERVLDAVAEATGLDRLEVRRRNLIGPDEMPFDRGTNALGTKVVYDSGDYPRLMRRASDRWEIPTLERELEARRAAGEPVGIGYGFFVEKSGLGPYAGARVEADEAGHVRVVTGAASVGQGVETVIAQICDEVIGVGLENISVVHGQTDQMAYGLGAFASRVTVMTGSAAHRASVALRERIIEAAAEVLEADPADLELAGGRVGVVGAPARSLTLGEVAAAARPGRPARDHLRREDPELGEVAATARPGRTARDHLRREDPELGKMAATAKPGRPGATDRPGLVAEDWFETTHMTYPYGFHAAVVSIDPGTGRAEVERYLVAYDVGRAVNPMLVEGQVAGGAAQGIGGALLEEFRYDGAGQPLAASFMDYLLPTAAETPPMEVLVTEDAPSPLNPLGLKGAGEGGTAACGAAIASAIDDALGRPGAVRSLPVTPEQIHRLAQEAGASSG